MHCKIKYHNKPHPLRLSNVHICPLAKGVWFISCDMNLRGYEINSSGGSFNPEKEGYKKRIIQCGLGMIKISEQNLVYIRIVRKKQISFYRSNRSQNEPIRLLWFLINAFPKAGMIIVKLDFPRNPRKGMCVMMGWLGSCDP